MRRPVKAGRTASAAPREEGVGASRRPVQRSSWKIARPVKAGSPSEAGPEDPIRGASRDWDGKALLEGVASDESRGIALRRELEGVAAGASRRQARQTGRQRRRRREP
jgi:hypothetical protein